MLRIAQRAHVKAVPALWSLALRRPERRLRWRLTELDSRARASVAAPIPAICGGGATPARTLRPQPDESAHGDLIAFKKRESRPLDFDVLRLVLGLAHSWRPAFLGR